MLTLTSPIETWLHRVPAGVKLALLLAATITLFRLEDLALSAGALSAVAAFYLSFGWLFFLHGARLLRPLLPFIVVVAAWHLWTEDSSRGLVVILHFVTAVAIANLVTMTTRLSDMIAVIERITPSIPMIGLAPKKLAIAMALAIRFIPVLGLKLEQIDMAWKARSTRRARWRVLVPAILAVLDDAEHVADALRARGGAE